MGSVGCLIFSRDRACQLDLLLRSVARHAPTLYAPLTVLYRASTREYGRGYALAFSEHADVKFICESDFEAQVRHWLRLQDGPVSFLVDDDVFYRQAPEPAALPWSFRGGDYDYPFSLDGNVYDRVDVEALLAALRFRNPTELEAAGHEHRTRLPFTIVHHGRACLVGVPLNRVSASSGMPHMGRHEYDLNERYLAGERLRLPRVSEPLPAHAPLELAFA